MLKRRWDFGYIVLAKVNTKTI